MNEHNPPAGFLAVAFAGFTVWYLLRAIGNALSKGYSPGKLGAIHAAGTPQYVVFLGGCLLGLVFAAITAYMGCKWMGFKITRS
ncbi:MAG: hypothetical protein ACO1RX_22845 [Candidatus Sericytochromatia bacterium]